MDDNRNLTDLAKKLGFDVDIVYNDAINNRDTNNKYREMSFSEGNRRGNDYMNNSM